MAVSSIDDPGGKSIVCHRDRLYGDGGTSTAVHELLFQFCIKALDVVEYFHNTEFSHRRWCCCSRMHCWIVSGRR
ncbi:hypothetical protein BG74_05745 [Sodalis-like endosymbiont of Proechinophthirus fluctus]|uniref:hypothetical protein n=1 Tax=Sodalis-like endosymbiont of Proechinophthirus fluctus TaxID=1462730 RepID=UPI0007A86D0B|nr:hypothetical protein [Sodalis-like endosymbiont of Proechinophthirus fluctus]KYP97072.1 hypothetical protein BG74_05745 [Sodalis-like endosymbiont of Proechinophthirus fluctus]